MAALSLTLLSLITSTLALPTTNLHAPSILPRQASAEHWSIPRMQMHMMSRDTGIPGNQWPESSKFNSSIDFDVLIPDHATEGMVKVNCQAGFANYTLPASTTSCHPVLTDGQTAESFGLVEFGMSLYTALGPRRPELSFILSISRSTPNTNSTLQGSIPITANDPSEPSSYLTCLGGAPYDGLRCRIGSYMSVRTELVIEGTSA